MWYIVTILKIHRTKFSLIAGLHNSRNKSFKIYTFGCRANSKIGINQDCLFLHCSRYLKCIHQNHLYTEMGPLLGAVFCLELQKLELSIKYSVWFLLTIAWQKKNIHICMVTIIDRQRWQLPLESSRGKRNIESRIIEKCDWRMPVTFHTLFWAAVCQRI